MFGKQWWWTRDELRFLDGLGLHLAGQRERETPLDVLRSERRFLLLAYRDSCELRQVWDGIEKQKVINHVNEALEGIDAWVPLVEEQVFEVEVTQVNG